RAVPGATDLFCRRSCPADSHGEGRDRPRARLVCLFVAVHWQRRRACRRLARPLTISLTRSPGAKDNECVAGLREGDTVSIQTCPHCQSPIEVTTDGTATITCASCGSEVRFEQERTRTVINERRRLDRFELVEQVGSGAFGIVWKARDPQLSRFVA